MSIHPSRAALRVVSSGNTQPFQPPAIPKPAKRPQVRRYTTTTLLPNGDLCETRHIAPALPLFEDAFCAFARGSLITTDMGPVAIEDLLPGDRVITTDGTAQEVLWKGATTVVPGSRQVQARDMKLTRIMSESFGYARPMNSVICGPAARLLHTPDKMRALPDGNQVLSPVQSFVDGVNIIETAPPTTVELFHICLSNHAIIQIGGLEFETYHPGLQAIRQTGPAMRELFLKLFPHLNGFGGFGSMLHPRIGDGQVDSLTA